MANTAQLAYAIFSFEGRGFSLSYVFITLAGFAPTAQVSKTCEFGGYSIGFFARYATAYSLYEMVGKGGIEPPLKASKALVRRSITLQTQNGTVGGICTHNLLLTRELLYYLSYDSINGLSDGICTHI